MKSVIALLDDDADRIEAMRPLLATFYPEFAIVVFTNAADMIAWLPEHLDSVGLFSLDHDLGPNQRRNGRTFDPGIGRDVANFLAAQYPQCPIILHTTNRTALPGMQRVLQEAGWIVSHVIPYGDLDWVQECWIDEVRRVLKTSHRD